MTVARSTRLEGESAQDVAEHGALLWDRRADLASAQGRRNLIVEALRFSTDTNFRRVLVSPQWRNYLAVNATFRSLPEGPLRTKVQRALAEADFRFVAHQVEVYARLPALLGYRLVPPLTAPEGFTVVSSAAGSMMTGLVIKAQTRPEIATAAVAMAPSDRRGPRTGSWRRTTTPGYCSVTSDQTPV